MRDLGGLPTSDGGRIRPGALIRSDFPGQLTAAGRRLLEAHGVGQFLDLRSVKEATRRSSPFGGDPRYRHVPLVDPARKSERDPDKERSLIDIYRASVDRNAHRIVAGIGVVADAPSGGVLVHCVLGKDRTGMLIALILRAAGVPVDVVAADYAQTSACLRAKFEAELAAVTDAQERELLRERQGCEPATIIGMLDEVDDRYGDVHAYLLERGLRPDQLARLMDRLRDGR